MPKIGDTLTIVQVKALPAKPEEVARLVAQLNRRFGASQRKAH